LLHGGSGDVPLLKEAGHLWDNYGTKPGHLWNIHEGKPFYACPEIVIQVRKTAINDVIRNRSPERITPAADCLFQGIRKGNRTLINGLCGHKPGHLKPVFLH